MPVPKITQQNVARNSAFLTAEQLNVRNSSQPKLPPIGRQGRAGRRRPSTGVQLTRRRRTKERANSDKCIHHLNWGHLPSRQLLESVVAVHEISGLRWLSALKRVEPCLKASERRHKFIQLWRSREDVNFFSGKNHSTSAEASGPTKPANHWTLVSFVIHLTTVTEDVGLGPEFPLLLLKGVHLTNIASLW